MTVAKEPGHRGERDISRKTIARGMPGVSGVTVVTNACAFYTPHAAAGASSARHSLRPLFSGDATSKQNSRENMRRDRGAVDCRHCEEQRDEAIHTCFAGLWIASLALAMTTLGCLTNILVMPGLDPGIHQSSVTSSFEGDGRPGIGERKRRRPSDGYARP
jgi:hypothetical protein